MALLGWFKVAKQTIRDLTREYEEQWTNYLTQKYDRNDRWPHCLAIRAVRSGAGADLLASPRMKSRNRKMMARAIKRRRFSPWEFAGWDDEDQETAKGLQRRYEEERKERLGAAWDRLRGRYEGVRKERSEAAPSTQDAGGPSVTRIQALLSQGQSMREIALALGMTVATVDKVVRDLESEDSRANQMSHRSETVSSPPATESLAGSSGDSGTEILDFLYRGMSIDDGWSVRSARDFRWWAHNLVQRVWAEPVRTDEGFEVTRIHAETAILRDVPDHNRTSELLQRLM